MRTHHTPGGYHPHAKDLMFYFVSYTKVGLSAGVWGFWRVFAGFGGCLPVLAGPCKSPRARRGLGCEGGL